MPWALLRVSKEGEQHGLDLHEHGISAYPEYVISSLGRPAGMPAEPAAFSAVTLFRSRSSLRHERIVSRISSFVVGQTLHAETAPEQVRSPFFLTRNTRGEKS